MENFFSSHTFYYKTNGMSYNNMHLFPIQYTDSVFSVCVCICVQIHVNGYFISIHMQRTLSGLGLQGTIPTQMLQKHYRRSENLLIMISLLKPLQQQSSCQELLLMYVTFVTIVASIFIFFYYQ